MKTFRQLTAGFVIMALMSAQIASAQFSKEDVLSAANLLPGGIDILYEFNTGTTNPLEDFFLESFRNEFMPQTEDEQAAFETLESIFADNTFTLAMEMNEESMTDPFALPDMFLTLSIPKDEFLMLMDLANEETLPTETYRSETVYELDEDMFILYLNELLIVTSTKELAHMLIDTYGDGGDTLEKNSTYKNAQSRQLTGAFLNMYIDPRIAAESGASYDPLTGGNLLFDPMGIKEDFLMAIVGEGVSVTQTAEGFDVGAYIEGDESKLTELGMMFDKYNFTPSLYNEVTGDNVILYTEHSNAAEYLEDVMGMFEAGSDIPAMYDEFAAWFTEETGTEFKKEFLPLLNGQNMLAIHNANQILPAATFIFDVRDKKAAAGAMVNEVNNDLREMWEGKDGYSYQITRAGNTAFYQHTFDLAALSDDPMYQNLPEGYATLYLQSAVTLDGKLVISTHPQLNSIFRVSGGMKNNPTFNAKFNAQGEMSSIFFVDFQTLYQYARELMVKTDAPTDMIQFMDDAAAGWYDLYASSFAEGNKSWGTASLRIDMEQMMSLEDLFFGLMVNDMEFDESLYLPPMPGPEMMLKTGYCDVKSTDWSYDYVVDLTNKYIVQGYEDGCFYPQRAVTRAEFMKMAVEGADFIGIFPWSAMSDQDVYFKDVPSGEWYAHYINQAAAIGYVDGYEDGTFRPNAPITRAEAVQILYNMSPALRSEDTSNSFTDIEGTDWFFDAVGAAYSAGLVQGRTPESFDPHSNITRAESAKIIDLFMNLYNQTMEEIA